MDPIEVSISGLGVISSLGTNSEEFWSSVKSGKSGIQNGYGKISGFDLPDRALKLSLEVASQAIRESGWGKDASVGVILATTTGHISEWEHPFVQWKQGEIERKDFIQVFKKEPLGYLASEIQEELGFEGPRLVLSTACAAGTQAMGVGFQWIKSGKVDRAIVIGVESLCQLTSRGFEAFQLVSDGICKPFDVERDGINLSEAAAAICLEKGDSSAYGQLVGWGAGSDAHSMTAPSPDGVGIRLAIDTAIKMSDMNLERCAWVHAHGTGSEANDQVEANVFKEIFGSKTSVSSTKAQHGHALAASGVLESVLIALAMKDGSGVPTFNLDTPISVGVQFKKWGDDIPLDPGSIIVKSTLGFGGTNGALVFRRSIQ